MKTMRRCGPGLVGMLLLVAAAAGAREQGTDPAPAAASEAQRGQRLEQAAREFTERSAGLAAGGTEELEIHVGEPRAMLGVQLGEARDAGGVRVAGLSPDGPAAQAGVRPGDLILSVNGHRVAVAADVDHEVRRLKPGERAALEVERGGKVEQRVVIARAYEPRLMPPANDLRDGCLREPLGAMADARPWAGGWGGLELAALSPGLGRYFGAERGVLVLRASAGGPLGLEDGDVVTAIGGREPQGVSHALGMLRSYPPGEHVPIAILRDRKPLTLDVSMPRRPAFDGHAPLRPPPAVPAPSAPPAPATPAPPGAA